MSYAVTLIPGDGIGPELADATVGVLEATGIAFDWDIQEAGEATIASEGTPLPDRVVESIRRNGVALKGPITTPVGGGFRSVNVALRLALGLYANVRPARSMKGVASRFEKVDLIIVRENTEDLYAGIEHRVGPDAAESIKIITRGASQRIARYAFEYAVRNGRRKVTAVHKANIMKLSDGLFLESCQQVAAGYEGRVGFEDRIVDNMCMQLVQKPELYDVLVAPNLYGDIISDLCAGLVGGLGVAPGANIGENAAVFEPVHGSAPKYAGKDVINPTAVILSAVMMLRYLQMFEQAEAIEHAVLVTLESGVLTGDVLGYDRGTPTSAYRDTIIGNLGKRTESWTVRDHLPLQLPVLDAAPDYVRPASRAVVGLDVFVESPLSATELGASLMELTSDTRLSLKMISSRGTKVFPPTGAITDTLDHWRCRFIIKENPGDLPDEDVHQLLARISRRHMWMHTEKLQEFDGELGFTRDQGEN